MDVSKNRGILPPKWMVEIMENPIRMHDLGGTIIFGNTHVVDDVFFAGMIMITVHRC